MANSQKKFSFLIDHSNNSLKSFVMKIFYIFLLITSSVLLFSEGLPANLKYPGFVQLGSYSKF